MSDFLSNEILKRHWSFLETEESIEKIEERKKLEVCLKEFLCTVPHDRKFFLPETAQVLKKSICEMPDFTAYKAIVGFEAISQYANNLFTKPWRKEFRILKMYSGFFQHEVKSNLLSAVSLFEAMGYRRLSDEILILDGPICPDQVANVSRDAMTAYVECQIIKHIYAGLIALGISCTWQDVYHYREKNIGGPSQAIKGISYGIQERRLRKEKQISADSTYATIMHSPEELPMESQCPNCMPCYPPAQPHYMPPHSRALQPAPVGPHHLYNGMTVSNGKLMSSYAQSGYQQQQHQYAMAPSRSIDNYNEPGALLPHRHSFEQHQQQQQQQQVCGTHLHHQQQQQQHHHHYQQPHYEPTYDCLDGLSMASSASYAAVGGVTGGAACPMTAAYEHPYNVSGNRYPLPYNISSQLNAHSHSHPHTHTHAHPHSHSQSQYATPVVTCNGVKGDLYGSGTVDGSYASVAKMHNCGMHTQSQQPPLPPARASSAALAATKDFQAFRQRSFPPDHLIDFDDRAPLAAHDFHAQMHALAQSQHNSFDYERDCVYESRNDRLAARPAVASYAAHYAQPRDLVAPCTHNSSSGPSSQPLSSDDMYTSALYARPMPRSTRPGAIKGSRSTDKYLRSYDTEEVCADNNHKDLRANGDVAGRRHLIELSSDLEATDGSYDSTFNDQFVHVGHSEHPQRSPTQESKNQDGVGSFASWDYVYQNLDRSGYTKDLGDRGDLLVQSLDLDSLHIANGGSSSGAGVGVAGGNAAVGTVGSAGGPDKRRAVTAGAVKSEKGRATQKHTSAVIADKPSVRQEKSILKQPKVMPQKQQPPAPSVNEVRKIKSALKSTSSLPRPVDSNHMNGNLPSGSLIHNGGKSSATAAISASSSKRSHSAVAKQSLPVATQVIVTSPNEWSCRFCTFLNPDSKRICEMCCHSKDFNAEAAVQKTPTCV